MLTYERKLRNGNECTGSTWLRSFAAIVIRYLVTPPPDVERGRVIKRGGAQPALTRFNSPRFAYIFHVDISIPDTMRYCRHRVLRQLLKRLRVALRCCWQREAIVMIDCGHMWRLWSGYIAALSGITQIYWVFFVFAPGCKTNDVLFSLWYSSTAL